MFVSYNIESLSKLILVLERWPSIDLTLLARGLSLYVGMGRQILMYKDIPWAERIKTFIMAVDP